ncbi:glycerophosphodiester phosphodiesterase [Pseudomonas abieticivorans]|uniref:glycerophosphodiester phosphodiesterase n=1 Tax=Pseudomonas abieticivorans TaxID=2931382 RepID=UPI0020C01D3C|nr:glycerophosphodiester phosphodiesterase [Pseudomonas sp. PIA16]
MFATWSKTLYLGALLMGAVALDAQADSHPGEALAKVAGVTWPAVIAHRGASYDAPESTRAAYVLARELGADYLEMDLQRTRDGALVALHDVSLLRTTDVANKFPQRQDQPVSEFTLAELKTLDAGSWYNSANAPRARPTFAGLQILTLDEIIDIAEANPAHKPGLYIETKAPLLFPGIEHDLKAKLQARGWVTSANGVAAGHRLILQTFEKNSLQLLDKEMPAVPKVLLLWVGAGSIEPKNPQTFAQSGATSRAAYYASQAPKDRAEFERWLDFAKANGAAGTGPSAALTEGGDQSYMDLVQPWMNSMTHDKGLFVHVYTVDDPVDYQKVMAAGVDGIFTNRASELLKFYGRASSQSVGQILQAQGF